MVEDKTVTWEEKYEKIEELGEGGNAKVFLVKDKKTSNKYALKILCHKSKEKKCRFIDEIHIICDNSDIKGIIPIIDYSEEEYWYTMPIAISVIDYIKNEKKKVKEIICGVIELAETLEKLHSKGIAHRDIKPSNLYYFEGRYCLGDFGLVEFPDNPNDFTRSDKGLGAVFTIAPEMKRDPKHADGKKADVFSLAKTMWMLLTGDERGFDGVYNFLDKSHSLRSMDEFREKHTVEIEKLLISSTDNNPEERPDIVSFGKQLKEWITVIDDFDKVQESDWLFLNNYLFGKNQPESSSWREISGIVNILNIIGSIPAYNHMMFSDEGGLDFAYAEMAFEKDCIYIYDTIGFCFVVKPKKLYYEGFDEYYKWNYFLLELDTLQPIIEKDKEISYERLVEDYPGHYVSAEYAQYGVYDYDSGEKLPSNYKVVSRYLNGKLLIVLKNGPYNRISSTYDGRHGMCSNTEFRDYISKLIELVECLKLEGIDEKQILNSTYIRRNPFKKEDPMSYEERVEQKSPYKFISENKNSWCFKGLLEKDDEQYDANIRFYLKLDTVEGHCFSLREKGFYLCNNGFIKESEKDKSDDIYYSCQRNIIISIRDNCDKLIKEKCLCEGYDVYKYDSFFSIMLERCGKPTHLFTKSEIQELMRGADDRETNILVIDENGYAQMMQSISDSQLYPVRNEAWQAGNMYVGRYSNLSDLNRTYICSLQGWLMYLETGRTVYMDYMHDNNNIEELIQEIKQYY